MDKTFNFYAALYKKLITQGDIQIAYECLLKYMSSLRARFSNSSMGNFSVGNVSPGYMDFTYFPFFTDFLRSRKLRFGIVLNHRKMRFELWLMGQNEEVQAAYWELLKHSEWNVDRTGRPRYSVLETVIIEAPDFDNLDALTTEIEMRATSIANTVIDYIKKYKAISKAQNISALIKTNP